MKDSRLVTIINIGKEKKQRDFALFSDIDFMFYDARYVIVIRLNFSFGCHGEITASVEIVSIRSARLNSSFFLFLQNDNAVICFLNDDFVIHKMLKL